MLVEWIFYIYMWPMHDLSSSLDNFGPNDYFLARKLCQKARVHMFALKISMSALKLERLVLVKS